MGPDRFDPFLLICMVLCLAGFHGLFFYAHLFRKALAWLVFQLGLALFFLHLTRAAGPLPQVLFLGILAAGSAVFLLLAVWGKALYKAYGTWDKDELGRKVPK